MYKKGKRNRIIKLFSLKCIHYFFDINKIESLIKQKKFNIPVGIVEIRKGWKFIVA